MAEPMSGGTPAEGLLLPHPDEALVREQNARRIGRRRQAAALALQVGQTSGEDLDRHGERRRVGGRFERIQDVPERRAADPTGLDISDIARFLSVLSFAPSEEILGRTGYYSAFAPRTLGTTRTGADG
jgi:hypothetical protein